MWFLFLRVGGKSMEQNTRNKENNDKEIIDETISILISISVLTRSIANSLELLKTEKKLKQLPHDKM